MSLFRIWVFFLYPVGIRGHMGHLVYGVEAGLESIYVGGGR